MDMERAINKLPSTGQKRKPPSDQRTPVADLPLAAAAQGLEASLGPHALCRLEQQGHTVAGIRISTVQSGE